MLNHQEIDKLVAKKNAHKNPPTTFTIAVRKDTKARFDHFCRQHGWRQNRDYGLRTLLKAWEKLNEDQQTDAVSRSAIEMARTIGGYDEQVDGEDQNEMAESHN